MLVRNYKGELVRMKLDNYTTDKEFYKKYITKN